MQRANTRNVRPSLEALEDRIALSIGPISGTSPNRVLPITGTPGNDVIVIDRLPDRPGRVVVDDLRIRIYNRDTGAHIETQEGSAYDPPGPGANGRSTLDRIRVDALGGNDIVINWTNVPATLVGGEGNDLLQGGFGQDRLEGGRGSDLYYYGNAPYPVLPAAFVSGEGRVNNFEDDTRWGNQLGVDTIVEDANLDSDQLSLYAIDLSTTGNSGVRVDLSVTTQQTVSDGRFDLILSNTEGLEVVTGSVGPDILRGNGRPNELYGDAGSDVLEGRGGDDQLYGGTSGGPGDTGRGDWYIFASLQMGHDTIHEPRNDANDVNDTLAFSGMSVPAGSKLTLDLSHHQRQTVVPGQLELTLAGLASIEPQIENVIGSSFVDEIYGNGLNNRLEGNLSNDFLSGRGGSDTLIGGWGSDSLFGGEGNDFLYALYPGAPGSWFAFQYVDVDILVGEGGTGDYQEFYQFDMLRRMYFLRSRTD